MKFELKKPCKNCPFLKDSVSPFNKGWLSSHRAQGIVDSLVKDGGTFPCHKTVNYDYEDDIAELEELGEEEAAKNIYKKKIEGSQYCAGALILMLKIDNPSQMTQIAQRLGLFKEEELLDKDKVVDSIEEFVNMHGNSLDTVIEQRACDKGTDK